MNLVVTLLIWTTLIATISCEEETEEEKLERIVSELKLTDWDLVDHYEGITSNRKGVLLHKQPYTDEIKLVEHYGEYLNEQSINFQKIPEDDIPYEHTRNYSLLLKPGDALLNKTEYDKLVIFAKESDHLSRTLRITHPDDPNEKIRKQTYLDLLATSRNTSKLAQIWSDWQDGISNHSKRYASILNLATEAASKNELYDAKQYWEMLSEYEDGYQKVETLWNEIEPTYRKLHEFVLNRINNYYGSNYTDIPVYLTGSNFGEDWSNLADLVVPHQQMYKDAKFAFEVKKIEDIYKLAEKCGSKMGFSNFTNNFWSKNNFEYGACAPTLLVYPSTKFSEVLTCKNLTWMNYLNAHETAIEAGLKSFDFGGLPRRELRSSYYEEAIINLGTIIAIQNLPFYGFTPESDYVNFENATEHGLAAKLLVALRVLPKLAYYIGADIWRLEELQNPSDNIKEAWWGIRKKYQGLESVNGDESDFLGDSYITANKPYLSKILGILLQFELLSYHQLMPFTNDEDLAEVIGQEADYRSAIRDIPIKSPGEVLSYNYAFSEVTSQHLLDFFQPLEEYLEQAPLLPYPTIVRERKIEIVVPPEDTTFELKTTKGNKTVTSHNQETPPPVQNDQVVPSQNVEDVTENSDGVKPATSNTIHSAGMYVLITIGACFFILVSVVVFKKLVKMKRPRTNNRRFEE